MSTNSYSFTYVAKITFQSVTETTHDEDIHADTLISTCHLDLDPMNLIYELDLDILKTHLQPKMKFLGQGFQIELRAFLSVL